MKTKDLINLKSEAYQLFEAGNEPSEIVAQLYPKVSQASIYRWINQFKNDDLRGVDIELEEEDLAGPTKSNDSLDNTGDKRSILKRFKLLFIDLLKYGEGHTWSNDQLRTVLRKAERMQDETERVIEVKADFEDNAIWTALEDLTDRFKELLFRHPKEVELYLTQEEKLEFEYYLSIDSFDQEYEAEEIARLKYISFLDAIKKYVDTEEEFSISESEDLLIATENLEEELEENEMLDALELVQEIKVAVEAMEEEARSAIIFSNASLDLPEEVLEQINVELNDDHN